jgi:hypothetical protein
MRERTGAMSQPIDIKGVVRRKWDVENTCHRAGPSGPDIGAGQHDVIAQRVQEGSDLREVREASAGPARLLAGSKEIGS